MAKRRALARGLDALLSSPGESPSNASDSALRDLPVDLMQRGRYQPRVHMDPASLEELASSIRAQGVVQPIVVRALTTAGKEQRYEIVAGERRWRAAQMAGLPTVPAVVRDISDDDALAMALIENIQREDLNPVEEAQALSRFVEEFGLTHQAAADAVGRSRVSVTNLIRLLDLDPEVRELMERGRLEMGHGRAILGLPPADQRKVAAQVVAGELTTRQTEALVRRFKQGGKDKVDSNRAGTLHPDVRKLEQSLAEQVGAPVSIQHDAKGRGRLTIRFTSLDEFEGILAHFK